MGGLSFQPPIRYCSLCDGQGLTYVPLARICSISHWGEKLYTHYGTYFLRPKAYKAKVGGISS